MRRIVFSLILLTGSAEALDFKVSRMQSQGEKDRSFILTTNLREKVVLDCHSFIQGLTIGDSRTGIFYLLDPWECEELAVRMRASLRRLQRHCVDADEVIRADYSCS
jgi:hypothetical protein